MAIRNSEKERAFCSDLGLAAKDYYSSLSSTPSLSPFSPTPSRTSSLLLSQLSPQTDRQTDRRIYSKTVDKKTSRVTLERNDSGVFATAASPFPVTANDAGSFDVTQHWGGNFAGKSAHFLVATVLRNHLREQRQSIWGRAERGRKRKVKKGNDKDNGKWQWQWTEGKKEIQH